MPSNCTPNSKEFSEMSAHVHTWYSTWRGKSQSRHEEQVLLQVLANSYSKRRISICGRWWRVVIDPQTTMLKWMICVDFGFGHVWKVDRCGKTKEPHIDINSAGKHESFEKWARPCTHLWTAFRIIQCTERTHCASPYGQFDCAKHIAVISRSIRIMCWVIPWKPTLPTGFWALWNQSENLVGWPNECCKYYVCRPLTNGYHLFGVSIMTRIIMFKSNKNEPPPSWLIFRSQTIFSLFFYLVSTSWNTLDWPFPRVYY